MSPAFGLQLVSGNFLGKALTNSKCLMMGRRQTLACEIPALLGSIENQVHKGQADLGLPYLPRRSGDEGGEPVSDFLILRREN